MIFLVMILCFIIVVLTISTVNLSRKLKFLKNQFSDEITGVNGKDLFDNITKSKVLYKELVIEFHPDKFVTNEFRKKKAEIICSKIAENKSSYRDLISIVQSVKNDFDFSKKFIDGHPEIFD